MNRPQSDWRYKTVPQSRACLNSINQVRKELNLCKICIGKNLHNLILVNEFTHLACIAKIKCNLNFGHLRNAWYLPEWRWVDPVRWTTWPSSAVIPLILTLGRESLETEVGAMTKFCHFFEGVKNSLELRPMVIMSNFVLFFCKSFKKYERLWKWALTSFWNSEKLRNNFVHHLISNVN